jgi:hypothetical protein
VESTRWPCTVTLFILAIATILSVLRQGRSRAVWLGFAVFGWVHLLFGWPDSSGAPTRVIVFNSYGFTGTYRARFAHMTLPSMALEKYMTLDGGSNPLKRDYTAHVLRSTAMMATAVVGAFVGGLLWRRSKVPGGQAGDASIGGRDSPGGSSP